MAVEPDCPEARVVAVPPAVGTFITSPVMLAFVQQTLVAILEIKT
jgi:hypothetical protein